VALYSAYSVCIRSCIMCFIITESYMQSSLYLLSCFAIFITLAFTVERTSKISQTNILFLNIDICCLSSQKHITRKLKISFHIHSLIVGNRNYQCDTNCHLYEHIRGEQYLTELCKHWNSNDWRTM